jgi:hypothetical protein
MPEGRRSTKTQLPYLRWGKWYIFSRVPLWKRPKQSSRTLPKIACPTLAFSPSLPCHHYLWGAFHSSITSTWIPLSRSASEETIQTQAARHNYFVNITNLPIMISSGFIFNTLIVSEIWKDDSGYTKEWWMLLSTILDWLTKFIINFLKRWKQKGTVS